MSEPSSLTFNESDYHRVGPGEAEDTIGGSIMSDLLEGDYFDERPDDYAVIYYLSRASSVDGDPDEVIAVYHEGLPDQRSFFLDNKNYALEDGRDLGNLVDWVEFYRPYYGDAPA